jgi:hypothetical protein
MRKTAEPGHGGRQGLRADYRQMAPLPLHRLRPEASRARWTGVIPIPKG